MKKSYGLFLFVLLLTSTLFAQSADSVSVYFRYKASGSALRAYLPGEFNNWGPNASGTIAVSAPSVMTLGADGVYSKTVRLRAGGGGATVNGVKGYMYKMHEHLNSTGSQWNWVPDPWNALRFGSDQNSVVQVRVPMVFQLMPAGGSVVQEAQLAVSATVASSDADSIDAQTSEWFLNGQLMGALGAQWDAKRQFFHVPAGSRTLPVVEGGNKLVIRARTKSGAVRADSTTFSVIKDPVVVKAARPAGLKDGITYGTDGSSATLSLFAPHKKFVHVIGDFTNWQVNNAFLMKKDSLKADSVWYWMDITGLTPGTEYAFQYLIDGTVRVADPYTEKTLDPSDSFITSATYPGLKAYPAGKTSFQTAVLHPGKPAYQWQTTDYVRPSKENLVIYELLVRDFVAAHDFKTIRDTLGYLKRLGVNAIHFMPLSEFDNNESWGYNPTFYFAVDKYYGPADDLKGLIDECHRLGIAAILDLVLNHSYGPSPLVRMYNEGDYGRPTAQNPWYNITDPNPVFSWGYDFNHARPATQYFVDRVTKYWLEEFKFDGFRFDFTKGFTNTPGDGGGYDASRIAILKRMANKIWSVDANAYVILEHFAPDNEERELTTAGMMVWGNHNHAYRQSAMGYSADSDFSRIFWENRGFTTQGIVGYMESHDEERMMYSNLTWGNGVAGGYSVKNRATAYDRVKMAASFFLPVPGPKLIWQFGEVGYDFSIDYNDRVGNKPIRWDYANDPERMKVYKTFAALIQLRNSHPVFTSKDTDWNAFLAGTVKRLQLSHPDMQVAIIGNFGVTEQSYNLIFQQTGRWYDFFRGDSIEVTETTRPFSLKAGEFYVYTSKKMFNPEPNIVVANEESGPGEGKAGFALLPAYPNPFNPETTVRFTLEKAGAVRLDVFDMNGRRVQTLLDGAMRTAGMHEVRMNGGGLASGVYMVRLQAGGGVKTGRITLLK
jgi:glycosidase